MTINTTDFRADYAGNGVTTEFPVPFIFFGLDELQVIERDQATGTETVLVRGSHYDVAGGDGATGTVTATPAPAAGSQWTIRRNTATLQQIDFNRNDPLPSDSVERGLDRATAIVQEALGLNERTLRVPLTDPEAGLELPANVVRANRLLGFDSVGKPIALATPDMSATTVTPTGGTAGRQLAEHLKRADPRNWGGVGDGVQDDTAALAAAATFAGAQGLVWFVPEGTWRHTAQLLIPTAAAGIEMAGSLLYDGAGNEAALVIGDGGSVNTQAKRFLGLRVVRASLSDWTDEDDIGIQLRNIDACLVEVRRVEGFTIGVQLLGVDRGCEDSDLHYGRIVNNRYGLDLRTATASAWMNSLRHYGGHFANDSGTYPLLSRFGVRFSAAGGAYVLHNAHTFVGPAFELQRQGTPGTVDAIPFLVEIDGRGLHAYGVRMEACSPFVARHTSAMNDATYEVEYVGTYGFTGAAVDYPSGATRAGGVVLPRHQAAVALAAPRLVAECGNVRAAAFRNIVTAAGGVGFDGLAVLSGNPSGPPTTLTGFAFGGLDSFTLNAEDVTIPTSRALAFIVDCSRVKEFVLAAEGSELRPVVMQFDASENVLDDGSPVLLSNMNATWPGTNATWWEGSGDLDGLTGGIALNRHQRVTLHGDAAFAAIGVRGSSSIAKLRALRLFCDALGAPRVLAGRNRTWGTRELGASLSWSVPSLAAGATTTQDVTLSGVRQGDFVTAGHAKDSGFQNGGVVFHAVVGGTAGTDQVRVTAQNVTGSTIVVGDGTLFVRAIRPRA